MDAKIDLIHYNNNIKNKLIPRKFFTNYKILLIRNKLGLKNFLRVKHFYQHLFIEPKQDCR